MPDDPQAAADRRVLVGCARGCCLGRGVGTSEWQPVEREGRSLARRSGPVEAQCTPVAALKNATATVTTTTDLPREIVTWPVSRRAATSRKP